MQRNFVRRFDLRYNCLPLRKRGLRCFLRVLDVCITKAKIIADGSIGVIIAAVMHQLARCGPIFHARGFAILGVDEMKRCLPEEMANVQRQVRMIHQLCQGIMDRRCLANDLECFDLELWFQIEKTTDATQREAKEQKLMSHWIRLAKALGLNRSNGFFTVLKNQSLDLWKVKREQKEKRKRKPRPNSTVDDNQPPLLEDSDDEYDEETPMRNDGELMQQCWRDGFAHVDKNVQELLRPVLKFVLAYARSTTNSERSLKVARTNQKRKGQLSLSLENSLLIVSKFVANNVDALLVEDGRFFNHFLAVWESLYGNNWATREKHEKTKEQDERSH